MGNIWATYAVLIILEEHFVLRLISNIENYFKYTFKLFRCSLLLSLRMVKA